jgi:dTDP-4-dehydrorhamnose reductase
MSPNKIKLLVIGATGQVGRSVVELAHHDDDFLVIAPDRQALDINNQKSIVAALAESTPDYVVNAAAYTDVEKAESDEEACYALNRDAVRMLGSACAQANIPLLHLSTDYVFDGNQSLPYTEQDETNPISVYGLSKLEGEKELQKTMAHYILLRVCGVFSPWRKNFVKTMFLVAQDKKELRVVNDQYCCPTGANDIARVLLAIIKQLNCGSTAWGTYHYVAADITTWHDFADAIIHEAALTLKRDLAAITPITTSEYPTKAKRPTNSVLDCQKILNTFGIQQRSWQSDMVDVIKMLSEEVQ